MTTLVPSPITGHALTRADGDKGRQTARATITRQAAERAHTWQLIHNIVDGLVQGEIGQLALAASIALGFKVLNETDTMPALDVARISQAADIWFKMHRLATGQSTSNAAIAHGAVDSVELAGKRADLEARLAALQSSTTVVEAPQPSDVHD